MTSSLHATTNMPSPQQMDEMLKGLTELLSLIAPLKSLLSNSSALGGGASQRLQELVEVLHGTGNGLALAVEDLKRMYSQGGEMDQLRSQISSIEGILQRQEIKLDNTHKNLSKLLDWFTAKP